MVDDRSRRDRPIRSLADTLGAMGDGTGPFSPGGAAERARAAMDALRADHEAWAAHQAEQEAAQQVQREENALRLMASGGWSRRRVAGYTWDGIPEPERSRIRAWTERAPLPSLLLVGPAGVGKTASAAVAIRTIVARHDVQLMVATIHYVDALELLCDDHPSEEQSEQLHVLRRADILLLDDLGAGGRRPVWQMSKLEALLDTRWDYRRCTVVTTNVPSDRELEEIIGYPAQSRLTDASQSVVIEWGRSTPASRIDRRTGEGRVGWRPRLEDRR
mgnify:CR=1 FL=1